MKHQSSLKIISLNIEMDHHLERIIPFLKNEQPDVILLQEVLGKDLPLLEAMTEMTGIYTIQNIICFEQFESFLGLLTLTKCPVINKRHIFYRGDHLNPVRMTNKEPDKTARVLTITDVCKDNISYRLANTHFTWSAKGQATDAQRQDVRRLLTHLAGIPEFILMGDFNAPRGKEIFDIIAATYKDNIPVHVSSTIDKNLHRSGDLGLVVDGLFTTPHYDVTQVNVVDGVSDHCAIVATIAKNK